MTLPLRKPVPLNAARRALGQVFTPRPIADWMAACVCAHRPARLLDPAVGDGVFIDAVADFCRCRKRPLPRMDAFEIDSPTWQRFCARPCCTAQCRCEDFLLADIPSRYDAIIANPPYVRHHSIGKSTRVFEAMDRLLGERIPRTMNLYGLFLLRIASLLSRRGVAAVITPAEWLNADFGVALKRHLLSSNLIDGIIHFDHAASVFDGVLTTASIVLLRRDRRPDDPVHFNQVSDIASLRTLDPRKGRELRREELDPASKWTPLFSSPVLRLPTGPRLGDIASCMRGIATGANDFFTLRPSDARKWKINRSDLTVCITKARQLTGSKVSSADIARMVARDERVYLLTPRSPISRPVQRYLAEGRRQGVHRRFLPSHRPTWYLPENRPPAPILVSVFARGGFKFVRNDAGALNLTAYHGIYLKSSDTDLIDELFAYLCSDEAAEQLKQHERIYAEGLRKLEPRDVESLPIPRQLATRLAGKAKR